MPPTATSSTWSTPTPDEGSAGRALPGPQGGPDGAGGRAQGRRHDLVGGRVDQRRGGGHGPPEGPSSCSPAAATPPPTTTRSGHRTVTRLAIPTARRPATASTAAEARSSPAAAAANTAWGLGRPPRRQMAAPAAKASTQPRLPQPQGGPSGSMTWWPSSPARPWGPKRRRPSTTTPPPTPVPRVRQITVEQPAAAPMRLSARVKERASLMSATGTPRRPASGPPTSRPAQAGGRLGRSTARPDASSNSPGTPTPAAATGPCSATSRAPAAASRPMTSPGSSEPVGIVAVASSSGGASPSASTTASLLLVPPTSMPR